MEHLRHCPTEAKHINLIGKSHLRILDLKWKVTSSLLITSIPDGDANELEKDYIILHDIALHSNIKVLSISGFGGVTFSSSANLFTNLVELNLYDCRRLQYFKLSLLHVKRLHMYKLPCLEWIVNDNSSDSSSTFSASLKYIELSLLNNLKGWCRCSEEEISRGCCHQFKSLERLYISNCYNLISIPQHTYIRSVNLRKVTEKILQQAVNHSKLESLEIYSILNFKSLRGVFQHLSTLCELSIYNCEEFDPYHDEDGCYSMKWKELASLKVLEFYRIPKMKYLPEGLQHITTLQTLRITECVNLTSIPQWVTSLQVFDIKDCPIVTSERLGDVED